MKPFFDFKIFKVFFGGLKKPFFWGFKRKWKKWNWKKTAGSLHREYVQGLDVCIWANYELNSAKNLENRKCAFELKTHENYYSGCQNGNS